jgi:hypothetical protein
MGLCKVQTHWGGRIMLRKKNLKSTIIILIISLGILIPNICAADPLISSGNGLLIYGDIWNTFHDGAITIRGTGFNSKSQAAPLIWDNCSGSNITDLWTDGWPNSSANPTYNIAYRTPINDVDLPHSHITKYLAGAHAEITGPTSGYNVLVWKALTGVTFPTTIYMSSYWQVDPRWNPTLANPPSNNFMLFNYSSYAPYNTYTWVLEYGPPVDLSSAQWHINDSDFSPSLSDPDNNDHNLWWNAGTSSLGVWVKTEYEIRLTDQTDGYIKAWDNGVLKVDYSGPTDLFPGTTRCISLGGFAQSGGAATQWRYFADIYFDTTPQRVMICTGSTWASRGKCEVQIPSAWSPTETTVTVNQGGFPNYTTAYLYIVDASGNANDIGNRLKFTRSRNICPEQTMIIEGNPGYYYTSIHNAYVAAATGQSILMQAIPFSENINLDRTKDITLKGGYNCGFSLNTDAFTTIRSLTVSAVSGKVTVDNLILK